MILCLWFITSYKKLDQHQTFDINPFFSMQNRFELPKNPLLIKLHKAIGKKWENN